MYDKAVAVLKKVIDCQSVQIFSLSEFLDCEGTIPPTLEVQRTVFEKHYIQGVGS